MTAHTPQSFYFIRHGQTDWNLKGLWQGQTDIPLNETGLKQAQNTAQRLKNRGITRVISSPLSRAFRTAEIIATHIGATLETDPRLKERYFGSYEGLNWREIRARHNIADHESHEHILPNDVEAFETVKARMHAAIHHWLNVYSQEKIAFTSHGGAARTLQKTLHAQNGEPYYFQRTENGWQLTPL